MERIIDVYYGRDNLPYKDEARTIHFPVAGSEFLGASQTTTIRFHYEQIGTDENVYTVESKRPDGKTGSQLLSKNTTEHYAEMSLSGWYSACKGDLFLSLKVYRGGTTATYNETTQLWEVSGVPVIESTGAIKLAINYTPVGRYEDYDDAFETFQQVLAALGDKLDTIKGIVGVSGLSQVDTTEYEEGQLFFDVDTKNIYKLESGKFVKINNKLEIVDVSGQTYQALLDKYRTQPFMSYFGETNNISVYQFKEITGGYELHCSSQKNGLIHIPSVVLANTFSTSDFTQLDFQSAPEVELQSETGTLSDLDFEKLLQPNATIKYNNRIFTKTSESSDQLTFGGYVISTGSSTYAITTFIIRIIATTKKYSVNSTEKICYTNIKIDQLLTNKQDNLVSGTNIKTINNISLLGSGNIDIQGGSGDTEWGSIGGNIADQTDLQNELQDIREVAEGKTNTYVIYDNIEGLTEQTFVANEYKRADGTPIATWADFLSYVDDSNTCSNTSFDNDSEYGVDIGYTYFITINNKIIKSNTLNNGDNIYVVQLNVPDRWFNEDNGCVYPLETSKVNLDNYSTKSETSTEVNKVAHDIAVEYDENTLYGSGDLCIKDKLLYKCNTNNTTGTWDSTKWDLTTVNSELGVIKGNYVDLTSAQTISGQKRLEQLLLSISNAGYFWKFGSQDGLNFVIERYSGSTLQRRFNFTPSALTVSSDNAVNIGNTTNRFKDIYLSGNISDGTNSVTVAEIGKKLLSIESQRHLTSGEAKKCVGGIQVQSDYYLNLGGGVLLKNPYITGIPVTATNIDITAVGLNPSSQMIFHKARLNLNSSDDTVAVTESNITTRVLNNIATTDQAFNVINASDIVNNTLTQAQYDLITNGKPTLIKGTLLDYINPFIIISKNTNDDACSGWFFGTRGQYNQSVIQQVLISTSKVISLNKNERIWSNDTLGFYVDKVYQLNGKNIPAYPSSTGTFVLKCVNGTLTWVAE